MPGSPDQRPLRQLARLLPLILAATMPMRATADLLVRFPAATPPERCGAVTARIEAETGVRGRWFTTLPLREPGPATEAPGPSVARLADAREAYKNLDLERARALLDEAESSCLAGPAAARCFALLFDVHLLRGTIALSLSDQTGADHWFRSAHAADPVRVVDPAAYPPKVVAAFARACAAAERAGAVAVPLRSAPPGAELTVDGAPVADPETARLGLGRHVVEARLPGYSPRVEVVEIRSTGGTHAPLTLELVPAPDQVAWGQLLRALSAPEIDLAGAGMRTLLARFAISHLLLVDGNGQALLRAVGQGEPVPLPPLGPADGPLSGEFVEAVTRELGPGGPGNADYPPPLPVNVLPVLDPDEVEEDEEDADTDGAPGAPVPDDATERRDDARAVFTSPWFWISLGVAAVVVGSVTVTAQVAD